MARGKRDFPYHISACQTKTTFLFTKKSKMLKIVIKYIINLTINVRGVMIDLLKHFKHLRYPYRIIGIRGPYCMILHYISQFLKMLKGTSWGSF